MQGPDYHSLDDDHLAEVLFVAEDRLERAAVDEIVARDALTPFLAQVVTDKQNWLAELPDWWAVVHATYLLGAKGGEAAVNPLLSALRWADAFDCDWVTEVMPSILGHVGPAAIPGLTMAVRDVTAGWSARDVAMKGLAAISLSHPDSREHVFRIIGERFMDEHEDRVVRQLAGQILLDFRVQQYRMALIKFSREEWSFRELDAWYVSGFEPEDVEWAFRQDSPDVWHYHEDWMRFYDPAEIQKRQKRWSRERLGQTRSRGGDRVPPPGGGRVLSFWRHGRHAETPPPPGGTNPEGENPAE